MGVRVGVRVGLGVVVEESVKVLACTFNVRMGVRVFDIEVGGLETID